MPTLDRRASWTSWCWTTAAAITILAWAALPGPAEAVSYVESSEGLGTPALDAGRTEVEMADVNDDGHIDLVSIGDHGSPYINTDEHGVMVWFGDGTGRWSVFQYGTFGYGGVAVGDVNGDGLADVGYGMHHDYSGEDLGDQLIEVALGDGTGRFWTAWDDGLATAGEDWGMFGTDFADVDADGDLDLASISFGCCSGVSVYLNEGDGTWTSSFRADGDNSDEVLDFGDVDGDGFPDLAVGWGGGTVFLGDGAGGFTLADGNLPGDSYRRGVSLGDADGDGRDDLAYVHSNGGLEVWSRGGDGTWTELSGELPASGDWEATQLHDMDGDGVVDLAAFGSGRCGVWLGDGAGGWTFETGFTTPDPGYLAAFRVGGDADHNGLPDIAIVAEEGGPFSGRNHFTFHREASVPESLTARLVAPSAGATLRPGAAIFVDWASAVPGGGASRAALAYSLDGGPWTPIEIGIPNDGRHQWTVPEAPGSTLRFGLAVATPGGGRALAAGPELTIAAP